MASQNKNKHPLIQMTTDSKFKNMYVNVGAPSDDCGVGLKTTDENGKCIQSDSPLASAAVWKLELSTDSQRKVVSARPFSRGLRNSMALAVHPSGLLIQGENSIDLPDEDRPYEELNILKEGQHYGWPYCHSDAQVSPKFNGKVTHQKCSKEYALPKYFMPAHSAPLGMLYYDKDALAILKGKLIISWHGYQKSGHRIVAYPTNENGEPSSNNYEEVVAGWEAQEGVRPRGAPTGLTLLKDGSILILDDKNSAILRLSHGNAAKNEESNEAVSFSEQTVKAFEPLVPFVKRNCAVCHAPFQKSSAAEILAEMGGSMINRSNPFESSFYTKIKNRQMPPEMIQSGLNYTEQDYEKFRLQIEAFLGTLNKK